jgi:hypothetical protein
MFCAPSLAFGSIVGIGSGFHVLRARTRFRHYRRRRVPFSILHFLQVFSGVGDVGYRFHVSRPRTYFRQFQMRRVPLSLFARPDSFSAVPRASGPVEMFCALVLVFGCTEGVGSRFHFLRSRTHFRRYRGRRLSFSCFARLYSFFAISRESNPIFMFCASGLVFGRTEGVGSRLHVLRSWTRFRR